LPAASLPVLLGLRLKLKFGASLCQSRLQTEPSKPLCKASGGPERV